jgi:integrase
VRPYRLRSTVGITLSELGVDLADVSAWLGHTDLETTRAHYVPVLDPRIVAAAKRLEGRLGWGEEKASKTVPCGGIEHGTTASGSK